VRIITLKEDEFNSFSQRHKYASIYQTSMYANFKNSQENFDVHYLGFENNGNLIGATMVIYKELFWGYKYAYSPRGFLIDYTDANLIKELTYRLINLLKKQKFIFFKIDPPVINSERDFNGNVIYESETSGEIFNILKNNNYEHFGFNLYNETSLTRFNAFAKLIPNGKELFNSFSKEVQDNIITANRMAVKIVIDESNDVNRFYDFVRSAYGRRGKRYFQKLIDNFSKNDSVKIFYAEIDSNKYAQNTNNLYNSELERNEGLVKIIESGDKKFDIDRVINDKIESDKILSIYKKDILISTDLLRNHPDGVTCGVALVINNYKGAEILINYSPKEYKRFNVNDILTYEIMRHYANYKCKYINLGSTPGNFSKKTKFYPLLASKKGFNSSVIEYIGEFKLIINPLMYKVYKNKMKKKK